MRVAVITVRVPVELHAALKEAAWKERKSLNEFCVEAVADAAQYPLRRGERLPTPPAAAVSPGA